MGDLEARCVSDAQLLGDALVAVDEEGNRGAERCGPRGPSPGGNCDSYLAGCDFLVLSCVGRFGAVFPSVVRRGVAVVFGEVVRCVHGAVPGSGFRVRRLAVGSGGR